MVLAVREDFSHFNGTRVRETLLGNGWRSQDMRESAAEMEARPLPEPRKGGGICSGALGGYS